MRSPKAALVARVTVGFLAGLALQPGMGRSVAAASYMNASWRGKVQIRLKGEHSSGQFVMSGAIADCGRWDELDGLYRVRTLFGKSGTITVKIGYFGGSPGDCQCNWRVTAGTKAYVGLRGRGYEVGMYQGSSSPTTHLKMTGWVGR